MRTIVPEEYRSQVIVLKMPLDRVAVDERLFPYLVVGELPDGQTVVMTTRGVLVRLSGKGAVFSPPTVAYVYLISIEMRHIQYFLVQVDEVRGHVFKVQDSVVLPSTVETIEALVKSTFVADRIYTSPEPGLPRVTLRRMSI